MTVLPTVRGQIEQAAQRQASAAPTARPARGRRRVRVRGGSVVVVAGVALALCTALAAIVLFGHRHPVTNSPAARLTERYPLTGDGIGNVRFGARPNRLVSELTRLLGLPEGASTGQRPDGLLRGICGFDHEVDWVGLAQRATASPYTHSAGLTVYFRRGRFAGYAYGPPWGDVATPLVRHGVMLATSQGLGLDEPIARGRQLYGRAFIVTTQPQGTPPNPRLERLPAWHITTATGLMYGFIDSPRGPNSSYKRTIGSISAGAIPNTPCRSHPIRASRR
jgi:hypothetical protein